jgi:monoamine oxidase
VTNFLVAMAEAVDVAVVGAGLAGLVAARDLQRAGLTTVVLEARDRVGGRTWNHTLEGGATVEVGGQWVGPSQDRMIALAEELGVPTFLTYDEGEGTTVLCGQTDPDLSAAEEALYALQLMADELPLEAPWLAERAREWDGQTAASWLDQRDMDGPAAALLRLVISSLFTAEPEEISLLHVLVYIRSAGGLGPLTTVPGGAQEQRYVGGSQLVSMKLAESLGDGVVRLGAPVRSITQDGAGVIVAGDGYSVTAKRVIVAVPIALADRIAYDPPLPAARAQLHQRMIPGTTIKLHFVYATPFWREVGSNGRLLTDEGPVTLTFDNSPPEATPGVIVGFVEGDHARAFARLSPDARRKTATDVLVRHFGPQAADVLEYVETDWSAEEWTRGCFGSNFPPGAWTRYGEVLREPVGLLHWAGAETSAVWMNYMDGAVRSGERAAAEVVAALG